VRGNTGARHAEFFATGSVGTSSTPNAVRLINQWAAFLTTEATEEHRGRQRVQAGSLDLLGAGPAPCLSMVLSLRTCFAAPAVRSLRSLRLIRPPASLVGVNRKERIEHKERAGTPTPGSDVAASIRPPLVKSPGVQATKARARENAHLFLHPSSGRAQKHIRAPLWRSVVRLRRAALPQRAERQFQSERRPFADAVALHAQ